MFRTLPQTVETDGYNLNMRAMNDSFAPQTHAGAIVASAKDEYGVDRPVYTDPMTASALNVLNGQGGPLSSFGGMGGMTALGGFGDLGSLFGGFGGGRGPGYMNLNPGVDRSFYMGRSSDAHTNRIEAHINWLMYMTDPICGSVVDILSTISFGDLVIHAPIKNRKKVDDVLESLYTPLRNMNIMKMLPTIIRDYLVYGGFVAYMLYDKSNQTFSDSVPFCYGDCDITTNPLSSKQPIINVHVPERIREFFRHPSPTVEDTLREMPPQIVGMLRDLHYVELSPICTLHSARTPFTDNDRGVSFYTRARYLYILSLILRAGTIKLASMRQGSVYHAQVEGNETGPDDKQLYEIGQALNRLWNDPTNSVLATGSGVNISEIMQGGEFWRWPPLYQEIQDAMMKAFGVNEGLLSGDMTYNNYETALSVFVEGNRKQRDKLTYDLFYRTLFPVICVLNGWTKKSLGLNVDNIESSAQFQSGLIEDYDGIVPIGMADHIYSSRSRKLQSDLIGINMNKVDMNDYINPVIEWRDETFGSALTGSEALNILEQARNMGVPIPMNTIIAAAHMKKGRLVAEQPKDLKDNMDMWQHNKKKYDAFIKIWGREPEVTPGGQIIYSSDQLMQEALEGKSPTKAEEQKAFEKIRVWQWIESQYSTNPKRPMSQDPLEIIQQNKATRGEFPEQLSEYSRINENTGKREWPINGEHHKIRANETLADVIENRNREAKGQGKPYYQYSPSNRWAQTNDDSWNQDLTETSRWQDVYNGPSMSLGRRAISPIF